MTKQTITAVFDTRNHAENAALSLRQIGIPSADITVSPETARDELGTAGSYADTTEPKRTGFMASLENMFGTYDDHATYTESLRRGSTLLTAHVEDAHVDQAVSLMEQHGAIDLEERESTWRGEGWTGSSASRETAATDMTGVGAAGLAMSGTMSGTAPVREVTTTETVSTQAPVATPIAAVPPVVEGLTAGRGTTAAGRGTEDVVQVVEERLDVGKRAVSRGKVRLHAYVVENQVSENVTLRDETVTIDRHAVDRPVAALGEDAFRERTIEMEEVDEEAVVAKTARVVEEIGIRKDVSDRTETIRDTVRSTKVDIEDGRTVGATATSGFATRLVKDMDVVGSDGQHVGIVDHVDGGMMKLKRSDPASDGQHHLLPADLVTSISADGKALLSIAAADAMKRWKAA